MNKLCEFEKKYEHIVKNIEEWNFIRNKIREVFIDNSLNDNGKKIKRNIKKILRVLRNVFFGFFNWFGKYDYLFFSYSSERKIINNEYVDKLSDPIVELVGKSLVIELPNPIHFNNNKSKYIVSESLIYFISAIIKLFIFVKSTDDLYRLEAVLKKENIIFSTRNLIKRFKSLYIVYYILLKIYKPKAVFVVCYYCRQPLIKAAKDLNIKVIELQHGIIGKSHCAYNSLIELNDKYIPDYLFSYGKTETTIPTFLIKNVVPIGSFYLEYVKTSFKEDRELKNIISNYDTIVGVTLQDVKWIKKRLLNFLSKVSLWEKNILYILIPRYEDVKINFEKNVIVWKKTDCYNTIMHCDIHMTVYSTCALEVPTLGIPNILLNINDFSSSISKMLNNYHTKIISEDISKNDFLATIRNLKRLSNEIIIEKNSNIFVPNYHKNLIKALKVVNILS